jgi:hypothetical protein
MSMDYPPQGTVSMLVTSNRPISSGFQTADQPADGMSLPIRPKWDFGTSSWQLADKLHPFFVYTEGAKRPQSFAMRESGSFHGPRRRFTAAKHDVCNGGRTGRSVDETRTASRDPKADTFLLWEPTSDEFLEGEPLRSKARTPELDGRGPPQAALEYPAPPLDRRCDLYFVPI